MKDEKQPKKKTEPRSNKKVVGTVASLIAATGGAVGTILGVVLPHMNKSEDNIVHHIHHTAPAPKPEAIAEPHLAKDMDLLKEINQLHNSGRRARAMHIFEQMVHKNVSRELAVATIRMILAEENNGHN